MRKITFCIRVRKITFCILVRKIMFFAMIYKNFFAHCVTKILLFLVYFSETQLIFVLIVAVHEEAENVDIEVKEEKEKKTRPELPAKTEPVIEPKPSDSKLVSGGHFGFRIRIITN